MENPNSILEEIEAIEELIDDINDMLEYIPNLYKKFPNSKTDLEINDDLDFKIETLINQKNQFYEEIEILKERLPIAEELFYRNELKNSLSPLEKEVYDEISEFEGSIEFEEFIEDVKMLAKNINLSNMFKTDDKNEYICLDCGKPHNVTDIEYLHDLCKECIEKRTKEEENNNKSFYI